MTVGVGQSLGGPKPKDTPSEPRISSEADPDSHRGYGRRLEILGVLWVVGAACVALVPTLVHGPYIRAVRLPVPTWLDGAVGRRRPQRGQRRHRGRGRSVGTTGVDTDSPRASPAVDSRLGRWDAIGVQLRICSIQPACAHQLHLSDRGHLVGPDSRLARCRRYRRILLRTSLGASPGRMCLWPERHGF